MAYILQNFEYSAALLVEFIVLERSCDLYSVFTLFLVGIIEIGVNITLFFVYFRDRFVKSYSTMRVTDWNVLILKL